MGSLHVPLDPNYPAARLAYMLDDANLTTVLTHERLKSLTPISDSQAVYFDSDEIVTQLQIQPASNVTIDELTSSHLAYVIYTSGSTGNPKGVMIEHQALHNRIDWMNSQYGCIAEDKILQKTPFSFDVSVWEFFWPLSVGAQLVLAMPDGHKDPLYLAALIQSQNITKLHFVPSMLSNVLAIDALRGCNSLKQVFCSGEALSAQHIKAFFSALPTTELHNLYGPTEAAIDVSFWACHKEVTDSVPIGKPIHNIQLHVLNNMALTPLGVPGELHIGGAGLARGYFNQPELTAEKFIPNPFYDVTNPNSSKRLYKTGDLVRYLPDGNIEFLGRIDHQIKIRGFRVELGEIEHQLLSHAKVNDAVVVTSSNSEGDLTLVAYVTHDKMLGESDESLGRRTELIQSLRQQLNRDLPDHMVPSVIMVLDQLPVTYNGKVDHKGLPTPDIELQKKVYVAPTTETERMLCEICREVLDIEQVGITDNFFELGGDSLLVIQVLARLKKNANHLNLEFSVQDFYKSPVVADIAQLLTDKTVEQQTDKKRHQLISEGKVIEEGEI